jgi:hypothetical protein
MTIGKYKDGRKLTPMGVSHPNDEGDAITYSMG